MEWITMDEAPLIDKWHFVACRYKDFWGSWHYTEGEWCKGWHIWNPDTTQWDSYSDSKWSSEFQWLKETK